MAESSSQNSRDNRRKNMDAPDKFAYDYSLMSEDQFLCSICLDILVDPVSTPCGHNFCKTCLAQYWDNTQHCSCPFCKEKFPKRPDLKTNTTLREVVEHFKKKIDQNKPEVLCDACTGVKLKALKSCLHCGVTFCQNHLEPHNNVPILKEHKLIAPVENLEDYICQNHRRPLLLFCRDDKKYVCLFCTLTDHKTHNVVPMEEESAEIKLQLAGIQTEVEKMIQDRMKTISDIKHSVALIKLRNREKEKADSVEIFTTLIHNIEENQAELLEGMDETEKAAEVQAHGLIEELEQEITELKKRNCQLEQISHTEDHIHLLQVYPSVCTPPHKKIWTDIGINPHHCVESMRITQSELQKSLSEELMKTINEMLRKEVFTELERIQQYAVDVILDPDTANPYLILSDDGKQVAHEDTVKNFSDNPKRFDYCVCVLGKEGFSSGRFYNEVQISGKTEWDLGVARESINRKRINLVNPKNGFWAVTLRDGKKYEASAGPSVSLYLREKPQKVGVFLDYKEGLISFYDVGARSLIYSFTGQSFTGKLSILQP